VLKTLAAAALATSVAFAPMMASAQVTVTHPAGQPAHQVVTAASGPAPATVRPKVGETAKDKARICSSEASAKGLQGKPRKQFIARCKKA
jgi:psiF repeat